MNTPTYMNEKEVSQLTKRAINTLRSDRHHSKGIPYRKVGRQVLYRLDEVISYLESNKIETEDTL